MLQRFLREAEMKPYLTGSHSSGSVMSGGHVSGGHVTGHHHHHHHHVPGLGHHLHHVHSKKRKRTVSADSGCDVNTDYVDYPHQTINPAILEETVRIWANRLETVIQQEVNRARQMSDVSKQALYIADVDVREKVLKCWKDQLVGIMDLTADLIQCVNNDIKESLVDSPLHTPREEFPLVKEEVDEADEKDQHDHFFKGHDNYVENFDYFDEESFDSVSLTDDSTENEPFKSLSVEDPSSDDQEVRLCEVVSDNGSFSPKFEIRIPVTKVTRRRVHKKLGFSKGYFAKAAAKARVTRTRTILRWIRGGNDYQRRGYSRQSTVDVAEMEAQRGKQKQVGPKQAMLAKQRRRGSLGSSKQQKKAIIKQLKTNGSFRLRRSKTSKDLRSSCKKKMFESVLDQEDIFDEWRWVLEDPYKEESIFGEWKWNFREYDEAEDIFQDWKWNLNESLEVEDIFKDWRWNLVEISEVEDIFKEWRRNLVEFDNWDFWQEFGSFEEILKNTDEVLMELQQLQESKKDDDSWTKWKFWDRFGTVKEISQNTEAIAKIPPGNGNPEVPSAPRSPSWMNWKFWRNFGPVKSIVYNTEATVLGDCDEDDEIDEDEPRDVNNNKEEEEEVNLVDDDDDSQADDMELEPDEDGEEWTSWPFWNEIGPVKEILENNTDLLVFGCFEDFLWVGNDDFLKDIGYLGGVVIGEVDSGFLGDCDDECESLLNGRVKRSVANSSTGSVSKGSSSPSQTTSVSSDVSTAESCAHGSLKVKRRKEKRKKQEERMQQRRRDEAIRVCKALDRRLSDLKKRKGEDTECCSGKVHITEDYLDKHFIFKSLVPQGTDLIFWDDSDREVDTCCCDGQLGQLIDPRDLIFWENTSRDEDDLINWDSAEEAYIRNIIQNHAVDVFADEFYGDENKENEPWRAYKLMGPLWVDVEDGNYKYSNDGNPNPTLIIKKTRTRKSKKPLSEVQLVDVNEVMWSIQESGKINSLKSELGNLPFWESPDVFRDACEQIESNRPRSPVLPAYSWRPRDPVNTFRTWRYLFTEPAYLSKIRRKWFRQPGGGDPAACCNMLDIQAFSEWASWALSEPDGHEQQQQRAFSKLQEAVGPRLEMSRGGYRGRKLAKDPNNRGRDLNKRAGKRPDSPTVVTTTISTRRQNQEAQSWIYSPAARKHTFGQKHPARKPVQKRHIANSNTRIFQPQTKRSFSRQ